MAAQRVQRRNTTDALVRTPFEDGLEPGAQGERRLALAGAFHEGDDAAYQGPATDRGRPADRRSGPVDTERPRDSPQTAGLDLSGVNAGQRRAA